MNLRPTDLDLTPARRRLVIAAVAVLVLLGTGFLALRLASTSDALMRRVEGEIEEKMPATADYRVQVRAISPGLDCAEIHGLRVSSEAKGIELWADVVRLDIDLETLRAPEEHDLPADLVGVRLKLPDGSTLEVDRMSVLRRADGSWESAGAGELGGGGRVEWDLATERELRRPEGSLRFDGFPLRLARLVLSDALPPQADLQSAFLDGVLRLRPDGRSSADADRMRVEGDLVITGLVVQGDRVAAQPVRDLEVGISGPAEIVRADAGVGVRDLRLVVNGVGLRISGDFERGESRQDGWRLALGLELPTSSCDEVVRAIPRGLLGEYAGFELRGTLAGTLDLELDANRPEATRLQVAVTDDCVFERVPEPARLDRFEGPFRLAVQGPNGEPLLMQTGPGTTSWVPLEEISPYFLQAVMAHEDATFPSHAGFAVFAIENSLEENLRADGMVRGASTISMQLAKNLFLDRRKTLGRKVREVLLTWWLERSLGKRQIMELYLNVIEYGPEMYGVRQASKHYFRADPRDLTPAQSVFLATLLPDPVGRHRQFEEGRLYDSTRREVAFLLRHMHEKGRIGQTALDYGLREIQGGDFFNPSFVDRFFAPRLSPPEALPASGQF